jgi:hypothetical protein
MITEQNLLEIRPNLIVMNEPKETYECSKCGRTLGRFEFHETRTDDRIRPVTSQCKECRSETYFGKKYPNTCNCCLKHRPIDSNGMCRKCNEDSGLRQCYAGCGRVLPLFLYFFGRSRVCKDCSKKSKNPTQQIKEMLKVEG